MSSLEAEISTARLEISADTISMSISELTNLYREGVLEIRPEFQRLYRWSEEQKSKLVESVLLGIPLPSLFVSQSEQGQWELVDGLQRVSTLLELQGVLVGSDGLPLPPLVLTETKYLPSLAGCSWNGHLTGLELSDAQRLDVRLARLDLKVIKRSSDPKAKFDLFQRLNSFGSALSPQEIRSAMIAGTNSECLSWLTGLAARSGFRECVGLSERLVDEQYDLELVLRFLMLHEFDVFDGRRKLSDFARRLNEWSVDLALEFSARAPQLEHVFTTTFDILAENGGDQVLRKWDNERSEFRGSFLNTAFEVLAIGAGYHISRDATCRTDFASAAQELWGIPEMSTRFATGLATQDRLVKTLPLGRKLMSDPPSAVSSADLA